jgi:Amidase
MHAKGILNKELIVTELWRVPATELAYLIRTREVSARKAAEAALQRLDAVNPRINAIVAHRPELVWKQADRIDRMVARGEDPGPLAGVPVTVKINTDQAGFATTNGIGCKRILWRRPTARSSITWCEPARCSWAEATHRPSPCADSRAI